MCCKKPKHANIIYHDDYLDYCYYCDKVIFNKHKYKHCNKCNKCHLNNKFIHCKSCNICIDVYNDNDFINHRKIHTV